MRFFVLLFYPDFRLDGRSGRLAVTGNGHWLRFTRTNDFGGKTNGKRASFAQFTGHTYVASHHLAESSGNCEAQPRATILAGDRNNGLGECVEYFAGLLGPYADPGVLDTKL